MIKNIIWDFDGTLFDTYPTLAKAYKLALQEYGIEESYEEIYARLKISASKNITYLFDTYSLDDLFLEKVKKYKKELDYEIHPFPYAGHLMKYVKERGGYNFINTHRGKSSIFYCKKYGLDSYIEEYVTKENNFPRKPDPTSIRYLLHTYQLDPSQTLMLGDRELDIECGINAHVQTCFFDSDQSNTQSNAGLYIKYLDELKKEIL